MSTYSKYKLKFIFIVVFIVISSLLFVFFHLILEDKKLSNLEDIVSGSDAVVKICSSPIEKVSFESIYKSRFSEKRSGSNPVNKHELEIISENDELKFFLGRDSRDQYVYWLYNSDSTMIGSPLAYLRFNESFNPEMFCENSSE